MEEENFKTIDFFWTGDDLTNEEIEIKHEDKEDVYQLVIFEKKEREAKRLYHRILDKHEKITEKNDTLKRKEEIKKIRDDLYHKNGKGIGRERRTGYVSALYGTYDELITEVFNENSYIQNGYDLRNEPEILRNLANANLYEKFVGSISGVNFNDLYAFIMSNLERSLRVENKFDIYEYYKILKDDYYIAFFLYSRNEQEYFREIMRAFTKLLADLEIDDPGHGMRTLAIRFYVMTIYDREEEWLIENQDLGVVISFLRPNNPRVIKKFMEENKVEPIDGNCPICLMNYNKFNHIIKIPCNHYFHELCLLDWLRKKLICPMCKTACKKKDKK